MAPPFLYIISMASKLADLFNQVPVSGVAIASAIIALVLIVALRLIATGGSLQKKCAPVLKVKKSQSKKKKVDKKPRDEHIKEELPINLDDFVADFPDTEDEEAARAEKKKAKRKLRKKKSKGNASPVENDVSTIRSSKLTKKEIEEGWETVTNKRKKAKSKGSKN